MREQGGKRGLGMNANRQRIDDLDIRNRVNETAPSGLETRVERTVLGEFDCIRVEISAVVEFHAGAQLELPREVINYLVGLGQ